MAGVGAIEGKETTIRLSDMPADCFSGRKTVNGDTKETEYLMTGKVDNPFVTYRFDVEKSGTYDLSIESRSTEENTKRLAYPMRGAGRNRVPSTPRNTPRGAMRGDLSRSIGISVCECVDVLIWRHTAAGRLIWRMVTSFAGSRLIYAFLPASVFCFLPAGSYRPSGRILNRIDWYPRTARLAADRAGHVV